MQDKELIEALCAVVVEIARGTPRERVTAALVLIAARAGASNPAALAVVQGSLPEVMSLGPSKQTDGMVVGEATRIRLVFEYWKSRTGHATARLLPERAQHIRARLREFSAADLCDAVDGCLLSDFHGGANDRGEKYDWIENIMRNGSVVEKHMARAHAGRAGNGALHDMNPETLKLRTQLDRAMEAGDVRAANELNKKLAEALRGSARADGKRGG